MFWSLNENTQTCPPASQGCGVQGGRGGLLMPLPPSSPPSSPQGTDAINSELTQKLLMLIALICLKLSDWSRTREPGVSDQHQR